MMQLFLPQRGAWRHGDSTPLRSPPSHSFTSHTLAHPQTNSSCGLRSLSSHPFSSLRPACNFQRACSQVRVEISPVSAGQQDQYCLRVAPVSGADTIQQVAQLRARAFYEDDRSRFVESFKQKFARGEAESLELRTAPVPPNNAPLCECLVAIDSSGSTLGCIDIRLPFIACKRHPVGVPQEDDEGCYILNVVVEEEQRGKGVGKTLMKAAMQRAVSRWGSKRLYTHVAANNEVAFKLYLRCGFKEHSVDAKALDAASNVGKSSAIVCG